MDPPSLPCVTSSVASEYSPRLEAEEHIKGGGGGFAIICMCPGCTIYSGLFKVKSKRLLSLVWPCLIVHFSVSVSHPKDLAPLPCDRMGSRQRETQNAEGRKEASRL